MLPIPGTCPHNSQQIFQDLFREHSSRERETWTQDVSAFPGYLDIPFQGKMVLPELFSQFFGSIKEEASTLRSTDQC
jgi:hypothetical protein